MTPAESTMVAELASLFALGYRRLLLTRRKALEQESHPAALCCTTVDANESLTGKERR